MKGQQTRNNECKKKAKDLINRLKDARGTTYGTPRRIKGHTNANLMQKSVLYNPDTRTDHDTLGGIRIFGKVQGQKSRKRDLYQPEKAPARINNTITPSHVQITLNTDESAIHNGWENATAGIGIWYADGNRDRKSVV